MYIVRIKSITGKESCGLVFRHLRNAKRYARRFANGLAINTEHQSVVTYDVGTEMLELVFYDNSGFALLPRGKAVDTITLTPHALEKAVHIAHSDRNILPTRL